MKLPPPAAEMSYVIYLEMFLLKRRSLYPEKKNDTEKIPSEVRDHPVFSFSGTSFV